MDEQVRDTLKKMDEKMDKLLSISSDLKSRVAVLESTSVSFKQVLLWMGAAIPIALTAYHLVVQNI